MAEQKEKAVPEGAEKYAEDLREQGAGGIDSMEHGDTYVISAGHTNVLELVSNTAYDYELLDDTEGDEYRRRVMLKPK
jgi:hypothetical protein